MEYGTSERIKDLTTLAQNNAYGSVSYSSLLSSAQAVADDPEVFFTDEGFPTGVPRGNRRGQIVDLLMAPYYDMEMRRAVGDSLDKGISRRVDSRISQEDAIKTKFSIDDARWDAMTPWEQAYYKQEYTYQ